MKYFLLPVLSLAASIAIISSSGCRPFGKDGKVAAVSPGAPAPSQDVSSIDKEALAAPAWKLQTTDGREVSSGEFAGKVVLVNFWATWCPPCVAEIPGFIALQKKYQGDLAVVGISVDQGGVELVKKFVNAKQINYPVMMADDTVVAAFGGFDAIPVTFLIDRQGRIRHKQIGQWQEAEVEAALQPLLAKGR